MVWSTITCLWENSSCIFICDRASNCARCYCGLTAGRISGQKSLRIHWSWISGPHIWERTSSSMLSSNLHTGMPWHQHASCFFSLPLSPHLSLLSHLSSLSLFLSPCPSLSFFDTHIHTHMHSMILKFFNVALRKFQITYKAHVIFLLDKVKIFWYR